MPFSTLTVLLLGLLLVATSVIHRFQMDDLVAYRESWAVQMEVGLLLILVLLLLFSLLRALVYLVMGAGSRLGHCCLDVVLIFLFVIAGIAIDSPTLLYAT